MLADSDDLGEADGVVDGVLDTRAAAPQCNDGQPDGSGVDRLHVDHC